MEDQHNISGERSLQRLILLIPEYTRSFPESERIVLHNSNQHKFPENQLIVHLTDRGRGLRTDRITDAAARRGGRHASASEQLTARSHHRSLLPSLTQLIALLPRTFGRFCTIRSHGLASSRCSFREFTFFLFVTRASDGTMM